MKNRKKMRKAKKEMMNIAKKYGLTLSSGSLTEREHKFELTLYFNLNK